MREAGPSMQAALIGLILFLGAAAANAPAALTDTEVRGADTSDKSQTQIDAETHERVLTKVAAVIRDHYADREVAEAIADTIMAGVDRGSACVSTVAEDLLSVVMGVIRSKVADEHFVLSVRGGQEDGSRETHYHERSPHGLRTVRMLENNTAYLEFDSLPGDSAAMTVVGQTLAELPVMQAIIFDLRDNNGGSGDMVVLLCSHLLEADVLLCTFSDRSGSAPVEIKTSAPTRHFGTTIPVFILTSAHTLSAAEALAYILQDYGRAVVVGERTAGMANPSRTYPIGERFELTVPFLLTRYGRSGRTFAGIGITPDIEVSADSALDVALEEIRKALGSSDR